MREVCSPESASDGTSDPLSHNKQNEEREEDHEGEEARDASLGKNKSIRLLLSVSMRDYVRPG